MTEKKKSGKGKIIVIAAVVVAALIALWAEYPLLNIPVSRDETEACSCFDEGHRYLAGEHFYFGRCSTDDHGGLDVLEWRVLRVKSDRLILISDRVIDCKAFDDGKGEVTWETSSLRSWLNGEFYNSCFSDEEKSRILSVTNTNPDNEYFSVDGGSDTVDKVFCMSIEEAEKYFSNKKSSENGVMVYADRAAKPTEYIREEIGAPLWWLRTPGMTYGKTASYVDDKGFICDVGEIVGNKGFGVRPMIEISR